MLGHLSYVFEKRSILMPGYGLADFLEGAAKEGVENEKNRDFESLKSDAIVFTLVNLLARQCSGVEPASRKEYFAKLIWNE